MHIESVSVKLPTFEVTNEWILDELEKLNPETPKKTIKTYQRQTLTLLKKSGSKTRFWRNRQKGEIAIDLIKAAMLDSLKKAGLNKGDIGLLIYCGIGKGFKEPANAYFFAHALKMKCSCFDITDACMSWIRAMEVAYHFLRSGTYKHIMIVNGEFNVYEHLYPFVWKIGSLAQLEYTLPSYTIGEASTSTIVSASDKEWTFDYHSAPELADLCTIPMEGYKEFCKSSEKINLHGINRFVSFGSDLFNLGKNHLLALTKRVLPNIDEHDIWLPHAASSTLWEEMGETLNINPEKNYTKVYPKYGNLVSASIPVGMNMALAEKKLERGKKVIFWPGSAGMSFCVSQFIY